MSRRIDSTNPKTPTALETAAFLGARRKMMVGPSAYPHHWSDVLKSLFASPAIGALAETSIGMSVLEAMKICTAICEGMASQVDERLQEVARKKADFIRELDAYMASGAYRGAENGKEVMDRLRSLRSKDRKKQIDLMFMRWAFVGLTDQLSFTPTLLSERTGIDNHKIKRFLEIFETHLGTTSPGFLIPTTSHALEFRPLVNLGEKYFCPAPHRLLWAIKPRFEDILKKNRLLGAIPTRPTRIANVGSNPVVQPNPPGVRS
jgi:hypothetical protein